VSRERFVKNGQAGSDYYGERGARTYNGGLKAVPPVGSRGKAPCQGAKAPLKLTIFYQFKPLILRLLL